MPMPRASSAAVTARCVDASGRARDRGTPSITLPGAYDCTMRRYSPGEFCTLASSRGSAETCARTSCGAATPRAVAATSVTHDAATVAATNGFLEPDVLELFAFIDRLGER